MSKVLYATQTFNATASDVIAQAEAFCEQYAAQGYELTLRQLYYRFIATNTLPDSRTDPRSGTKNTEQNYKWLGDLVSRARVGGRIDWDHITDRTRIPHIGDTGWSSPESILRGAADGYNIPKWTGQPWHVEVWVEKEALAQIVSQVANRWDVSSFACKGSPSTSAMHDAALRLRRHERNGKKTEVIYLGDHDPTGLDISRDIADRLALFRSVARVNRIALNWDQITDDLPPSPVKLTDSRAQGYIDLYHDPDVDDPGTARCWELDALEPQVLDALIEAAILARLDRDMRQERIDRENQEREVLTAISQNFSLIQDWLRDEGYLDGSGQDDDNDEREDGGDDDEL